MAGARDNIGVPCGRKSEFFKAKSRHQNNKVVQQSRENIQNKMP